MTTDRTVARAFVPPAALGIGAFVAVVGVMSVAHFARAMQEASWFGPLALFAALMAVGVTSAAMGLGLPRAIALLAAVAPWAIAALGSVWSIVRVSNVLDAVGARDRAVLFCAGYAESLAGRVVVTPVVAAMFVGIAVSALLRARVRDDERWSMRALAALALVGAGFAIASATTSAALHEGLAALAMEAPDVRASAGAAMNSDAELGRIIGLAIAALGGALLLVVVALSSASGSGIGGLGVVACALALLPALALDVVHEYVAWKAAHTGEHRPWRGVASFSPLMLDDGGAFVLSGAQDDDVLIVTRDAIVLGHDRVMTVSSTNATSQDVRAYVGSLVRRSAEPGRGLPSTLFVAFDARTPDVLVTTVLAVARDAGAARVELVGVARLGNVPGIAGLAAPTLVRAALLGTRARDTAGAGIDGVDGVDRFARVARVARVDETVVSARGVNAQELVRRFPKAIHAGAAQDAAPVVLEIDAPPVRVVP